MYQPSEKMEYEYQTSESQDNDSQEDVKLVQHYRHKLSIFPDKNNLEEEKYIERFRNKKNRINYNEHFIGRAFSAEVFNFTDKQVLTLKLVWGPFQEFLTALQVFDLNPSPENKTDRHYIKLIKIEKSSFVIKGFNIFFDDNQFEKTQEEDTKKEEKDWMMSVNPFEEALKQIFLLKIASVLETGPYMNNFLGFDLLIFADSIEIAMEECLPMREGFETELERELALNHLFRVIHHDIKQGNIRYSPYLAKNVFIDYGLGIINKNPLGFKTFTQFKGTIGFASDEMTKTILKGPHDVDLYNNDLHCLRKCFASNGSMEILKDMEKDKYILITEGSHFQRYILYMFEFYLYYNFKPQTFLPLDHMMKIIQGSRFISRQLSQFVWNSSKIKLNPYFKNIELFPSNDGIKIFAKQMNLVFENRFKHLFELTTGTYKSKQNINKKGSLVELASEYDLCSLRSRFVSRKKNILKKQISEQQKAQELKTQEKEIKSQLHKFFAICINPEEQKVHFPEIAVEEKDILEVSIIIIPSVIILELFPQEELIKGMCRLLQKTQGNWSTQLRLYVTFFKAVQWVFYRTSSRYKLSELEGVLLADLQKRMMKERVVSVADRFLIGLLKDLLFLKTKGGELFPEQLLKWLNNDILEKKMKQISILQQICSLQVLNLIPEFIHFIIYSVWCILQNIVDSKTQYELLQKLFQFNLSLNTELSYLEYHHLHIFQYLMTKNLVRHATTLYKLFKSRLGHLSCFSTFIAYHIMNWKIETKDSENLTLIQFSNMKKELVSTLMDISHPLIRLRMWHLFLTQIAPYFSLPKKFFSQFEINPLRNQLMKRLPKPSDSYFEIRGYIGLNIKKISSAFLEYPTLTLVRNICDKHPKKQFQIPELVEDISQILQLPKHFMSILVSMENDVRFQEIIFLQLQTNAHTHQFVSILNKIASMAETQFTHQQMQFFLAAMENIKARLSCTFCKQTTSVELRLKKKLLLWNSKIQWVQKEDLLLLQKQIRCNNYAEALDTFAFLLRLNRQFPDLKIESSLPPIQSLLNIEIIINLKVSSYDQNLFVELYIYLIMKKKYKELEILLGYLFTLFLEQKNEMLTHLVIKFFKQTMDEAKYQSISNFGKTQLEIVRYTLKSNYFKDSNNIIKYNYIPFAIFCILVLYNHFLKRHGDSTTAYLSKNKEIISYLKKIISCVQYLKFQDKIMIFRQYIQTVVRCQMKSQKYSYFVRRKFQYLAPFQQGQKKQIIRGPRSKVSILKAKIQKLYNC